MLKDILKKVRKLEVTTKNRINSLFSGNYRSVFRGQGIEFADIRPYDADDDIRHIDWKTTAKQGEIYVKTYHESRNNTLFFIVDGSPAMYFSSVKEKKYEKLLETLALTAFAAVQNGDLVGMLFYGTGAPKIFPPKKGRKNVLQILKFCIQQYQTPPQEALLAKDLSPNFKKILLFLKHATTIFWLQGNDLTLSCEMKKQLKMLRIKHDVMSFVFTDPLEENFNKLGTYTFQDTTNKALSTLTINADVIKNYRKIRQIKKLAFLKFFQKNKMETLFISQQTKVFQSLFIFFQKRQKKFH